MSLIKCPECDKEISDKAKCCIHCGYPLKELKNTKDVNHENLSINNNKYSVKLTSKGDSSVKTIKVIREELKLGLTEAKELMDNLSIIKANVSIEEAEDLKFKIESVGGKVAILDQDQTAIYQSSQESKITRCPRCGGTAFTPVKRKFSILAGFATNKIDLVCNNCGKVIKAK